MSKEQFKMVQRAKETSSIANGVASTYETPITVVGHALGAKWPEAEKMSAGLKARFEGMSLKANASVKEEAARETEAFYHGKTQKVNPILAKKSERTN